MPNLDESRMHFGAELLKKCVEFGIDGEANAVVHFGGDGFSDLLER